jgi:DNA-binding CsgD family transcriptional regulator
MDTHGHGVDTILAVLYDVPLGTASWSDAMAHAAHLMGADAAVISRHGSLSSAEVLGRYNCHRTTAAVSIAVLERPPTNALEQVGADAAPFRLFGRQEALRCPFIARLEGIPGASDVLGSIMRVAPDDHYAVAFVRHGRRPGFNPWHVARLEELLPHVLRAVTLWSRTQALQSQCSDLQQAMAQLPTAVIVVDAGRCVSQSNTAAGAILGDSAIVHLRDGRLSFADAAADHTLGTVLRLGQGSHRVALRPRRGMTADLVPLEGCDRSLRRALVLVRDGHQAPLESTLQQAYRLTAAEVRVLVMLIAGGTRESIAHDLGLSIATVKTHLNRLFSKTGTNRQADLILEATGMARVA